MKQTDPTPIAAMIEDVRIRPTGSLLPDKGLLVEPVWRNVDRPTVGGYALRDTRATRALVERVRAAMLAGVFFRSAEVRTDVNGKTYVEAPIRPFWKHINSRDLTRLGF